MQRAYLLGCLALIALSNGLLRPVEDIGSESGFVSAAMQTFGISAIVWLGLARSAQLIARSPDDRTLQRADVGVAAVAAILILVPVDSLSWVALSLVLAYGFLTSSSGSPSTRAGYALGLACTVSLFWSPKLFSVLSQWILTFDATMVGMITGTGHTGNTVPLADGSGELWIAPKCSSFASLSLVPVCWLTLSAGRRVPLRRAAEAIGLASIGVVLVNVTRIGLIGLYPSWYEQIHGEIGSTIAGWCTIVVIVAACYRGAFHADVAGSGSRARAARVVFDAEGGRRPVAT